MNRYRKLEHMFDSSVLAATEKIDARGREIQTLQVLNAALFWGSSSAILRTASSAILRTASSAILRMA